MAARITNADLLAALTGVTTKIDSFEARLAALESGQHSTPTLVAEITSAPSARKASKKGARKGAQVLSSTGRPLAGAALAKHQARAALTPAQQAEKDAAAAQAREAYKARKEALSPLNKALFAQGLTGDAWAGRFENIEALKAAFATLTKAQATAALEALKTR